MLAVWYSIDYKFTKALASGSPITPYLHSKWSTARLSDED
jgi:hypothetical protein